MGGKMSKKVQVRVSTCKKGGGKDLNLDDCDIYDKMPEGITSLTSLVNLNLSHNHLTTVTSSIGRLSHLVTLDISYNEVEELPQQITKLKNLTELNCSTNLLVMLPSNMNKLLHLQRLDIGGNAVKQLPASLAHVPGLRALDFSGSRLLDWDPTIFECTGLKELILHNNELDELSENLVNLASLEILDVTNNKIKIIPPAINQLVALRIFKFAGNQISELPAEVSGLIHLEELDAGHNLLTDISALDLSQWHNMTTLSLNANQLTSFNRGVGQMQQLRNLNLEDNLIKSLPREIGWVGKTLRSLLIARNKIVRLPGEISFLNPTVKLSLDGNPLVDPFNMLIGNMKTLTHIKPYCITYLRAFPDNCIAVGDSVLQSNAGVGTRFFIEARDFEGNVRVNGKDKFTVRFANAAVEEGEENFAIVKDLADGTYQVAFNNRVAGMFMMHIENDGVQIRNSPFTHQVLPGPTVPANCKVVGGGISDGSAPPIEGEINSFMICAFDQFSNPQILFGEPFTVNIMGGNNPLPLVEDQNNGTYKVQWTPAWAGMYEIQIGYSGFHIAGSPFTVSVPQQ